MWVRFRLLVPVFLMGLLSVSAEANKASGTAIGAEAQSADIGPQRISMDFQDASLMDVLKAFSQQTGINVIASSDVADRVITVYFEDVTSLDALDQILRAASLTYERAAGSDIYIVKPDPQRADRPQTITRVYQLRYARVSKSILAQAAAKFATITPFEARSAAFGSTSGSSSSSSSSSGGASGEQAAGVGIDVIIRELLTEYGKVIVDGRTNRVIVTDIADNFPRIEAALTALDVRTPQILVDVEVIETTLTKLKDLGFEWGSGSEGDLISFTPGSRTTRFPFGFLGDAAPTGPTHFSTSTLSAVDFQGVLQALQVDGDTKILARPKVLTLDNESALIKLTTEEAIGFQSTTGEQTSTTTSTPERSTTGVILVVTPQVNENDYITMLVEPAVSKTVASKISAPSGQATPRDPKTRSTRVLVRIRSGDTLVVGGLIDRSDETAMRRVPVLSGVPFIGEAFKNEEINNSASELIVFLTPRILDEPSEAQMASAVQSPLGSREQEAPAHRQEAIESVLNKLE